MSVVIVWVCREWDCTGGVAGVPGTPYMIVRGGPPVVPTNLDRTNVPPMVWAHYAKAHAGAAVPADLWSDPS